MCDLLDDPAALKALFDKHAGADGKLSQCQLRGMVKEKLGDDYQEAKDPAEMEKMFECWDKNGDGKLDFEEFKSAVEMIKKVQDGMPCDMLKCNK